MINCIYEKIISHQIGIIEHDTLPGIVGLATEENAKKIQRIKQRCASKGFIVLIPSTAHLDQLTLSISESGQKLIDAFWPGPLTIIFEKHPKISTLISGKETTIAIRYPKHPMLSRLLTKLNQPLISTSANISGDTIISNELLTSVDFTFGNLNKNSVASTIVDATKSPIQVLRQGVIKPT